MIRSDPTDRSLRPGDECLRRNDAEVLRRAQERAALAEALGATDSDACGLLHAYGLRASTAALVEWLPAVEVAWLDGADEAERHALRVHFNVDDRVSAEGMALLDGWLAVRPSDRLFDAARLVLRARLLTLGAQEREALLAQVLALCEASGRSAGGCFGVGPLSSQERGRITAIQGDLERPL